jgi:hypothetical protein
MTDGLLKYDYIFPHFLIYSIRKPFLIYDLQLLLSEFPYIFEGNLIFFFISVSLIGKRRFYFIQNIYLVFLEVESIQYLHALTDEEESLLFFIN